MSLVERFVVGVDMQSFGHRPARIQVALQRELDRMLDEASESAGVSRKLWKCMPAGDGETAVLPADVDMLAVVRRFVLELDQRLTDHNDDHSPGTRIRLRVAMHIDVMTPGALGYAGPALTVLQRLLDSAPVRTALIEDPSVNLAQVISESLFQKVVVSELSGLRPRQFQQVQVTLPAKEFHQTAYLYVPRDGSAPSVAPQPSPPPPGFPFPKVVSRPKQRPMDLPEVPSEEPPGEQPALSPAVQKLVLGIRESLKEHAVDRADALTTLALLEAAGRSGKGWLRATDGRSLVDALFTEVDTVWAEFSEGAWGFGAQRVGVDGFALSGPRQFRALSVILGWRGDQEETVPHYREFARRGSRSMPFYPTLRNPERERYPEWYDEWSMTVMSAHVRLQRWER